MDLKQQIQALEQILERERRARMASEQLIEEKATELYSIHREVIKLNSKLEQLVAERTEDLTLKNEGLQVATNRLALLIQNLQFAVLLEDEYRKIVMVNQRFCDLFMTPVAPEKLIGADCAEAAEETKELFQDSETFIERVDRLLEDRQPFLNEELHLKNGKVILRDFIPIWSQGKYQGHLWIYNDVTEKRMAELKLSEQRQFYENILNSIPADIAVFNNQHQYLFVNPVGIKDDALREWIIGKTDEDYCRMRGRDLGLAKDRSQLFNKVMKEKKQVEWEERLLNKEGEVGYFLRKFFPVLDASGEVELLIGYGVNITERKKWEQEVERSEKRYRDLFDYSQALICTHDMDGVFINVNPAISELMGYAPGEMIGRKIEEFIPYDEKGLFKTLYLDVINEKGKAEGVFRVLSKEGKKLYLLFKNYKMEEYGSDPYIIGFSQDISEMIAAEKELRVAKKITEESAKAKEVFLANMSHEIRTPMNGVMGIAGLLGKTSLDEEQRNYLRLIQESANNLLVIINDVLDLEKIIMGKLQLENLAFSLPERIEMCVQSFTYKAEEKGLTLLYKNFCKDEFAVIGDPYRINQVMNNLINNAIKFTDKGSVLVETRLKERHESKVFIEFIVNDTGVGIPENKQKEIFEPFVQASSSVSRLHGGTGLGLSICKDLINMMGGELMVDSLEGKGSTFHFVLPFEISSMIPNTQKIPDHMDYKSLGNRKILVAEDVELNQFLAKHILESWGFEVVLANNGLEAVERVKAENFDLILMDIQMPEMDGIAATEAIRKLEDVKKASLPIVALTANVLKGDSDKYLRAGMNDYLAKPFDESKLFVVISKNLQEAGVEIQSANQTTQKISNMETIQKLYDLAMVETISGGDKAFVKKMVQLFIDTIPQTMQDMEKAAASEQWEATGKLAHKMKSTIDSMGIVSLKAEIRTLEANGKASESVDQIPGQVQHINEVLGKCIEQIKKDFGL